MVDTSRAGSYQDRGGYGRLVMLVMLPVMLLGVIVAVIYGFELDKTFLPGSEDTPQAEVADSGSLGLSVGSSSQSSTSSSGDLTATGDGSGNFVSGGSGGQYFELPEILVNLASTGRRTNFMKLTVSVELGNLRDAAEIERYMPRIIDMFLVYLRELRVADVQGSAGMTRLREELLKRVNIIVRPVEVRDILFKDILVQ